MSREIVPQGIIARQYDLSSMTIIELNPLSVDYGKTIEEVVNREGLSSNSRLNSSNFSPLRGVVTNVAICLLQIQSQTDLKGFVRAIKEMRLTPETFPTLEVLSEYREALQRVRKDIGVVIALGSYLIEEDGDIAYTGLDLTVGRFGLFWQSYGFKWDINDIWFVFSKEELSKLLPENPA